MPARNLPIQVLSCCDTCGNLQPLRFRFEDREHSVHTVSVTEIVDGRRVEYVGLEAFVFSLQGPSRWAGKLYELRYTVATHRWTLAKEVY